MAPFRSWKARITKTTKSLEDLIERSKPLTAFNIPNLESEDETTDILKGKQATIITHITNIEKLLESLKQAQLGMEEVFNKLEAQEQTTEQSSYEEYTDTAFTTISNAEDALVKLSEKQTEITTRISRNGELEQRRHRILAESNKREWDAFWAVFKANIEDQPIPLMMKYNYLLQTLTGEARQVASRYQISEDNYPLVIEALKHKYGQDSSIIEELFAQLEKTTATGSSTAQQISLLDQISAIMAQLSTKGQDTNHRMLLNMVLKKFEPSIQLKALEKREQLENPAIWTWQILYAHLSGILELKDKVEQSQRILNDHTNRPKIPQHFKEKAIERTLQPCIYCKRTNHISKDCRTIPATERVAFLIRNQMCLNCAKTNHKTADCRSQGCFRCGQKHHSSTLCREGTPTPKPIPLGPRPASQPRRTNYTNAPARTIPRRGPTQTISPHGVQNVITLDNNTGIVDEHNEEETQVNQVTGRETCRIDNVVLLTGTATVEGPRGLQKVRILLDTGSELSFIDAKLVDEMKLPVIGSATLRIRTFGSEEPTQKEHRIVKVNLVTKEGSSHTYELFDNEIIANTSNKLKLTKRDWEYVQKHGINLSSTPEDQGEPRILIGCDHLWEMVDSKQEHPRKLINKGTTHQLVAFSDASNIAMAACVYIKHKDQCKVLIAKTKLPSLKGNHTIPKLELNALTLAARLTLSSYKELREVTTSKAVYLFSDSEIALNWIKNANSASKSLGVLVNNRIKEIKNIVEEFNNNNITVHFGYIRTTSNPSDCASRGLTAKELQSHIWWEGPDFLKENPEKMSATSQQAAADLLKSLNDNARTLLEEKELQRRLDLIYDDISHNIANVDRIQKLVDQIRLQLNEKDPDKALYQTIADLTYQLGVTKQKMIEDHQLGNILWELYHLMIQAGEAKKSSKQAFETKQRKEKRENSRTVNNTILQKEIQHINDLLAEMSKFQVECFIEFPKENVVLEQLGHIRALLDFPRGSLEIENKLDNLTATMDRVEKCVRNIDVKLTKLIEEQKTNTELLLDSQINAMIQIQKITRKPNQAKIALARRRLAELESIKDRTFGRKRTLLVRDKHIAPKCSFCCTVGEHDSDRCYKHKSVEERKQILAEAALCEVCLGLCDKQCTVSSKCEYCGSSSHHSALCVLPEEKQQCITIIRHWDFLERPQCAEQSALIDKQITDKQITDQ
ncbi:zinc knuckle [Ostertagia ostertagi]